MAFQSNAFQVSGFQDSGGAPVPIPVVTTQTPAGRPRSQRFIARFNGEDHYFRTSEELDAFVSEAQKSLKKPETKAERKRAKHSLSVQIEPEFQQELYAFDLPSIQPLLNQGRFEDVGRIINQFDRLRMHAQLMAQDDEEVLLLL